MKVKLGNREGTLSISTNYRDITLESTGNREGQTKARDRAKNCAICISIRSRPTARYCKRGKVVTYITQIGRETVKRERGQKGGVARKGAESERGRGQKGDVASKGAESERGRSQKGGGVT